MANDKIVSSQEAFETAIAALETCSSDFQMAYLKMADAVGTLDSTWNGEASEAFKQKFEELKTNLKTSDGTLDVGIQDIRDVIAGHLDLEEIMEKFFAALTDVLDPFLMG